MLFRSREDLYFRLSVFPIVVPPLRERGDDVLTLAYHFVERYCHELNKKVVTVSAEAIDALRSYPWPGNVRELQNCMERAVILCEGDTIHARHLSLSQKVAVPEIELPVTVPWEQLDLSGTLGDALARMTTEVERRKIRQALAEYPGDKALAASALRIGYKTLLQKIRDYRLDA